MTITPRVLLLLLSALCFLLAAFRWPEAAGGRWPPRFEWLGAALFVLSLLA